MPDPQPILPDGALTVGQRLQRIEDSITALSARVERILWYVLAITGTGALGGIGINSLHLFH